LTNNKKMKKDSHKRSMLKSLIWRILGVIILASITWFYTHSWITVGLITIIHHATFLLVFYLHERLWFMLETTSQRVRRILKAITYEVVLGMGIGGLIVLLITGEWSKVSQITLTYTAVKLITYYIYESIWTKE